MEKAAKRAALKNKSKSNDKPVKKDNQQRGKVDVASVTPRLQMTPPRTQEDVYDFDKLVLPFQMAEFCVAYCQDSRPAWLVKEMKEKLAMKRDGQPNDNPLTYMKDVLIAQKGDPANKHKLHDETLASVFSCDEKTKTEYVRVAGRWIVRTIKFRKGESRKNVSISPNGKGSLTPQQQAGEACAMLMRNAAKKASSLPTYLFGGGF